MRLENYRPAKNNVLLEEVKVSSSGNIILNEKTSAGYYKVIGVGPMCKETKVGDYIISTLQLGALSLNFTEGGRVQIPEHAIEGYYYPSEEEVKKPTPVFNNLEKEEQEEFNVIDSDSDGGNNELGTEPFLRDN